MNRRSLFVVIPFLSIILFFGCAKKSPNMPTEELQVSVETEREQPQVEEQISSELRYELSKQFCYDGEGKLSSTVVREYDDKGYVIKETVTLIDVDGSESSYWYDEVCDDNGNLVEDKYMTEDGLTQYWTYKYDEYNNEIECITYDSDGNIMCTQTSIYDYDSEGRKVKETIIQVQEGIDMGMEYTYNYTYDEDGKLMTAVDAFGGEKVYEYDENDFLIKVTNKVAGSEMITKYINDEYGNAIKEEYYDFMGVLSNYNENEYIVF